MPDFSSTKEDRLRPLVSSLHPLRAAPDVHRINFAWLIRLRWVAILGQAAVIIGSAMLPEVAFSYATLAFILLLEVLSNLALISWARKGHPRPEMMVALVLIADIIFLTALLSFTGGAQNPFSLLYLIHVALAALVLRPLWTWLVTLLSIGAYIGLHFFPVQAHSLPWAGDLEIWTLHTQGRWIAFVVSAAVIAVFINMIQKALTRRDEELIQVRDDQLRNEKLASLATLAAGAAHEFSTPLSTIALVANELQHGLKEEEIAQHFIDDTELIRDQVERCRDILRQMSADAGESMGEIARPVAVYDLIEHTLQGCRAPERVDVKIDTEQHAVLTVPPTALGQALRGLVNNALEASEDHQSVELLVSDDEGDLVVKIRDQGRGISPAVLERVGEPFFTTKETGKGMGLGVFLARTLIEKIDGSLTLESRLGEGTLVMVRLPGSRPLDSSHSALPKEDASTPTPLEVAHE